MRKTYLIHARIIDGVRDTAIEDGILVFTTNLTAQKGGRCDKIDFVGEMSECAIELFNENEPYHLVGERHF